MINRHRNKIGKNILIYFFICIPQTIFIYFCNCSVPPQLQAKIYAESPLAMVFLLGRGTLSYGQRSESADLLNSYIFFCYLLNSVRINISIFTIRLLVSCNTFYHFTQGKANFSFSAKQNRMLQICSTRTLFPYSYCMGSGRRHMYAYPIFICTFSCNRRVRQ